VIRHEDQGHAKNLGGSTPSLELASRYALQRPGAHQPRAASHAVLDLATITPRHKSLFERRVRKRRISLAPERHQLELRAAQESIAWTTLPAEPARWSLVSIRNFG